jgi:small-conductance mechanosensitive channel
VLLEELEAGLGRCFQELRALKSSLDGHNSAVTALTSLVDALFYIILGLALCLIFEVDLLQLMLPLGTVIVSASFAIGPTVATVCQSLILVLITRPFDVGDRITASGVLNGEEMLLVKRIDVLTTTFLRVTNRQLQVPNAQLLSMAVENLKRSPPAVVRLDLQVSCETSDVQLDGFRRRINSYLEGEASSWLPGVTLRIMGMNALGGFAAGTALGVFGHVATSKEVLSSARAMGGVPQTA